MRSLINGCDILSNSKYHNAQPLAEWVGDVGSLVREMKRRAGVSTDQELARFIGAAQSTVANWKQRGAVPEAALLKFESALANSRVSSPSTRVIYARAIAMRVPEVWYGRIAAKSAGATREIAYLTASMGFNALVATIAANMEQFERSQGLNSREVAAQLLDDEAYLLQAADWLAGATATDLLSVEDEVFGGGQ